MTETVIPMPVISRNGCMENDVIPSSANVTIRTSGYFDSPANRDGRS